MLQNNFGSRWKDGFWMYGKDVWIHGQKWKLLLEGGTPSYSRRVGGHTDSSSLRTALFSALRPSMPLVLAHALAIVM